MNNYLFKGPNDLNFIFESDGIILTETDSWGTRLKGTVIKSFDGSFNVGDHVQPATKFCTKIINVTDFWHKFNESK